MDAEYDSGAAVATEFALHCGLHDAVIQSSVPCEGGGITFLISGVLSISAHGLLPEDAEVLKDFMAGAFSLRVVVCNGKVKSHAWEGIQMS